VGVEAKGEGRKAGGIKIMRGKTKIIRKFCGNMKKIEKLLYSHVQIKSRVAEPDISAGLLFQDPYLSTGYVTYGGL